MKKEYDFSKGKVRKTPIVDPKTTKVQTSIRMDFEVMEWAQKEAEKLGIGYQTFLNMKLKEVMTKPSIESRVDFLEKKILKRA
ncbi:MAG: BrnA antitoxin family protein [Pseudobdellovibrionaceae bacterium]|jgi:uncharacterized protein (DUF4415 family)